MTGTRRNKFGRFLSYILRHHPDKIGLRLDDQGWADTGELISKSASLDRVFSMEDLKEIVLNDEKQRFAFNEDDTRIRANQGHSIEVDLNLMTKAPPDILYHGTVSRFLDDIRKEGLKRMDRHHVHLSVDKETAIIVGRRRGKPVILTIKSGLMHREGYSFLISENGVWLTDTVPSLYIDFK